MNQRDIEAVVRSIKEVKESDLPKGAFTTRDVINQLGCGGDKASKLIRDAIELGLCRYVGFLPRENRVGGSQGVPHYQWVDDLKD